ncbi:recombinase family protein [Nocardia grenadensis]|uniref:recombinase family protein n=1 Tax=Nocardia grenadensis TaxID=931537 RepID=UPI0014726153
MCIRHRTEPPKLGMTRSPPGCEQILLDKVSGKLAARPELDKALLVANRPGDQLVVTELNRLGRPPAMRTDGDRSRCRGPGGNSPVRRCAGVVNLSR